MKQLFNEWRTFLNEAQWYNDVEQTREKYDEEYHDIIEMLAEESPFENHKYIGKMAEWAIEEGEDPHEIIAATEIFVSNRQSMKDRGLKKLDLMQYSSFEEFTNTVEKYMPEEEEEEAAARKASGSDYAIIAPLNEESAIKYGKNTEWCISATKSRNYFEQYFHKGLITFVFVIDKNGDPRENPLAKVALHFLDYIKENNKPQKIWNANDDVVEYEKVYEYWGDKAKKNMKKSIEVAKNISEAKIEDVIDDLKKGEDIDIIHNSRKRKEVARETDIPELINQLAKYKYKQKYTHEEMMEALAKNPNTPPKILQKLTNEENEEVKLNVANVAKHPDTPPKILQKLAEDESEDVKANVAEHPNTPPRTLQKLAESGGKRAKKYVAKNPNTPSKTLQKLAGSEYKKVKENVAKNPNTPSKTLQKLAGSEDKWIRRSVVRNPDIPLEVLKKLANDEDIKTKKRIASDENTPQEILQKMANDGDAVKIRIANNPNTPPKILRKLAKDKNDSVRMYVAKNSNTPPEVLQKLKNDNDIVVRKAVYKNLENRNLNESKIHIKIHA